MTNHRTWPSIPVAEWEDTHAGTAGWDRIALERSG